ncbi:conserved protein of unknown function [Tenacibaculum sp. 190130A14a]|uniref:Uncharacterized protein n=1 Tax=Tenacibaculum polynesiense TaxID=3137857 RepID=A0ABM9PBW8_9FLAO
MHSVLYLLCPTDCLETHVNSTFKHQNYFYTSLGNSFTTDYKTIDSLKTLMLEHNIREISVVLSNDNPIFLDALEGQFFTKISGLKHFYSKISNQRRHSEIIWNSDNRKDAILSHFLNNKIKELQDSLGNFPFHSVKINGKIYDRFENSFKNVYSSLTCLEKHSLN